MQTSFCDSNVSNSETKDLWLFPGSILSSGLIYFQLYEKYVYHRTKQQRFFINRIHAIEKMGAFIRYH